MRKTLLALAICASSIGFASAQSIEGSNDDTSYGSWGFSGYIGNASIDSDTAFIEGVEDSAITIGLFADYRKNKWLTSVGVDVLLYDDNQEFSQVVVGDGLFNSGDVSLESSDASATFLTFATGIEKLYGEESAFYTSLQGGFSVALASERSIGNCTNCYSEDIDIDGGLFVQGGIGFVADSFKIGLQVRQYLGGDGLGNIVGLQISSKY